MRQRTRDMDLWNKFVELAIRHFGFLEKDFQFKRKEEKRPFIWYESDKIRVGLYYGEWRHELDFGINRLTDNPQKFPSIGPEGLVRLTDWREAKLISYPVYPKTESALEFEVPRLAQIMKKYGTKILKCESGEFERVERIRQERIQEINESAKLNIKKSRFRR